MRNSFFLLAWCLIIFSCKKNNSNTEPTPTPSNNGPIGGTYSFSGLIVKNYDTIPGNGITTITEYTTTGSNLKGSTTITASSINSKGLMYDYSRTGTTKEVNQSNGAVVTTNHTPANGSSGQSTSTYASNYTINTSANEITVDNAQYLFNSAFISLPSNKKHKYSLSGNTLKITSEHYDAAAKSRTVNEATFTKQ